MPSTMIWIASLALAQPAEPPPDPHFGLSLRAIVESWDDTAIGSVYGTGGFATGGGAIIALSPLFSLDIEAAYKRKPAQDGSQAHFEVMPMSAIFEWIPDRTGGPHDLFVGMGPTVTPFAENHPANGNPKVVRGTKAGLEVRFGGRVDTGMVQPRLAPAPRGLHALELEIYGARRIQQPSKNGFQLGAWRAGLGILFRM